MPTGASSKTTARGGSDARLGRRDEKDLGVGLAVLDVLERRDRGEPARQPARLDRQIQVRPDPARTDRQQHARRRQTVEQLANPRHQRDLTPRQLAVADLLQIRIALSLDRVERISQQLAEDARIGHPERLVDELGRQRQPGAPAELDPGVLVKDERIDENAVVIEDGQDRGASRA